MVIVVVYEIDDRNQYPVLSSKSAKEIEYWVREGELSLGSVYDNLPGNETYLEHPVSVTVVK